MKKLPIIILLSAAGLSGVAFAQTSATGSDGSYGASATTGTARGGRTITPPSATANGAAPSTDIGKDIDSYGKPAGAAGSKVSPSYGKSGSAMTHGAGMPGAGATGAAGAGGMNWTCPAGYTLSTATRDGSPLCYPSSGPIPGGR